MIEGRGSRLPYSGIDTLVIATKSYLICPGALPKKLPRHHLFLFPCSLLLSGKLLPSGSKERAPSPNGKARITHVEQGSFTELPIWSSGGFALLDLLMDVCIRAVGEKHVEKIDQADWTWRWRNSKGINCLGPKSKPPLHLWALLHSSDISLFVASSTASEDQPVPYRLLDRLPNLYWCI